MNLNEQIYNFFNEARPRTKNVGVEDIPRPGSGRAQKDTDLFGDEDSYKERVVKKYEITRITDKGVEKNLLMTPFEILQIIRLNPDNKDIKFEDIKVGEKYKYSKKTPGGAEKKGEIVLKNKTPKEKVLSTNSKSITRDININPKGLKSIYKPGAVHEIIFNNITKGVKQKEYIIFRTITEQEFTTLNKKSNLKVQTYISPSEKSNHFRDVYYITIPTYKYGTRSGADYNYFIYLKETVVKDLTSEQKDKLKLVLIPIKDISEGITKRPLDLVDFMSFLTGEQKKNLKKTKPSTSSTDDEAETLDVDLSFLSDEEPDTEEPSDEEMPEPEVPKTIDAGRDFSKEDKAAASVFVLDNDRILDKIRNNYDISKTPSQSPDKKKQAKNELDRASRLLMDKIFDSLEKESERDAAVEYVIKNRLEKDNKGPLYNIIKIMYNNMKSLKESSFLKEEEERKKYLIKTTPGSRLDGTLINSKVAKKKTDDSGEVVRGEYIVNLTNTQVRDFKSSKGVESGFKDIEDYIEKSKDTKEVPVDQPSMSKDKADEGPKYKVGVTIDGGKEIVTDMSAKQILKFVKYDPKNKDISFEDIEVGAPFEFSQKLPVGPDRKGSIVLKSKTPVGQKGGRTEFETIFRSDIDRKKAKQDKSDKRDADKAAKEKAKADKPEMKTVVQMGRTVRVPVNMGVKMATINPSDLIYKYYIVDKNDKDYPNGRLLRDADGKPLGTDNRTEAMEIARKMGSGYSVFQKAEMKFKRVDITEALSKEDITKLKSTRVSFTIQSDLDPDKQFNISDNVREVKEEKTKIVLVLAEAGMITFDKEGTGIFKYSKDNKEYQALNVPSDLSSIVKKALAPAKDTKEPESQLEAYIRKRIRQAIKEAEVSQYWGYQGKDVKKKRLKDYMKKYHWGFQTSEDPYEHSVGSEVHGVVTKLVHELGDEGVSIFNSYAPKGFEAANLDDLDQMSDTPLGSQLTQPYNPDSLTARGGRVAEEDGKVTSIAQQYLDKVNAKYKNIEDLAKGYNSKDRDIMGSESVKKVIQKAISQSYGKDAAKAGPELKKAFMSISDEDLKNNP